MIIVQGLLDINRIKEILKFVLTIKISLIIIKELNGNMI